MSVNSLLLRPWIEALRPVRGKLTVPLETIFREKSRPETVHSLATDILTDYASDDPGRLAELLMVSDPKAYVSFFPVAAKRAEQILPVFQDEVAKKATYSRDDRPFDPSWVKPDAVLVNGIESADGLVADRFAFCQTMPLDEFLATAGALRKSGYRPIRFRPYADEQVVRVAAVWARRRTRLASRPSATPSEVVSLDATLRTGATRSEPGGPLESRLQAVPGPAQAGTPTQTPAQTGYIQALPVLESRLQAVPGPAQAGTPTQTPAQTGYIQASPALESRLQAVPGPAQAGTPTQAPAQTGYIPVDVAGYVTLGAGGKHIDRYAALWVEKSGDDDARLHLGATDDDLTDAQKPLDDARLIPRTLHALRSTDRRVRYSGVWGKPTAAGVSAQGYRELFAWDFAENQALFSDRVLIDVAVGEAGKRLSVAERTREALKRAEKTLQTKPDDLSARLCPRPGLAAARGK